MITVNYISVTILIATVINIFVFTISWRRKSTRSGLYFALGMFGISIWTLASALDYAVTPVHLKIFFAKIEAFGYHSALTLFALFSIHYAGNERLLKSKWAKVFFLALPVANILLTATNELHGLIWAGFTPTNSNIVVFERGPAFGWIVFSAYLLVTIMLANLWSASRKGSEIARHQARTLAFALLFPVAVNLIYLFSFGGVEGVDWTSITFSVSGALIARALYGTRLLDIIPIARDKLINSLSDGMIVLDLQNRVIDINHAATSLFGANLIGKNLTESAPSTRPLLKYLLQGETRTELVIGESDKRFFDVATSPLVDSAQKTIGRLLLFRDITERKKNELRLLQLEQAVEQSPTSVVITDPEGNIVYVNPYFESLTGYTQMEIIGKNPRILQSGETPNKVYDEIWKTIQSGKPWRGELLNKKKNGELYWEFQVIAPVFDHEGNVLNFIAVKEDVTERKRADESLQEANKKLKENIAEIETLQTSLHDQAIRDPLTQLHNRRFLNETIEQTFHIATRRSETLSVILLDIDHFKTVNDSHGHTAGDEYLIMLSNLLKDNTRKSDIICRYGGEEFLLVLHGAGPNAAKRQAEKLRQLVEGSILIFKGHEIKTTVSLGIASMPAHGAHFNDISNKADQALYTSKQAGRNRVTVWEEGILFPVHRKN